jgi:hypothetical protein
MPSSGSGGSPLIVMGMHRSGTSLVTSLLSRSGVFMGADCNSHEESCFFRGLNDLVFGAAHAEWDWPMGLAPLYSDEATCEALIAELTARCASAEARAYLGWKHWLRARSLDGQGSAWGWKDPRNTCTLPFWLRVFPGARVVNVYRDGVDVAASLVKRERARRGRLDSGVRSSRCLDPARAFALWAEYVEISLDVTEDLAPTRVRDVRYESLIEKPEERIRELITFAGVDPGDDTIRALAAEVEPERARPARRDPEFEALRSEQGDHPLMQRLDYGASS